MKFTIITSVPHIIYSSSYLSYAPYIREMNIWIKYVDEVVLLAPISDQKKSEIDIGYDHGNIRFIEIDKFDILTFKSLFFTLFKIPRIALSIYKVMKNADHIHFRCPSNVGLLACFIQILFPNKFKTAKYAGNWDPKVKNPWSYKLQKYILNNTLLTKNMQVLVYGNWKNMSKNIKPFFTASYFESEKKDVILRDFSNGIKIIFVGTLSSGKRPFYAIQLIEELLDNGLKVELLFFGDGNQRKILEDYILDNNLFEKIFIKGNQDAETIKKAYQESHFVILPSQSEGWPKVIAEGMFWGCVPIATNVSCVLNMLDNGNRGLILELNLQNDNQNIKKLIQDYNRYNRMSKEALNWSRKYTLDYFEQEIKLLLQP